MYVTICQVCQVCLLCVLCVLCELRGGFVLSGAHGRVLAEASELEFGLKSDFERCNMLQHVATSGCNDPQFAIICIILHHFRHHFRHHFAFFMWPRSKSIFSHVAPYRAHQCCDCTASHHLESISVFDRFGLYLQNLARFLVWALLSAIIFRRAAIHANHSNITD